MLSKVIAMPLHNSDQWTFVTRPHADNLGAMVICKTRTSLYTSYICILDVIPIGEYIL